MTQTDPFADQDVPKISEIVCNLEPISSDSSLIPWILRMFASYVKWNLLLWDFSPICETLFLKLLKILENFFWPYNQS
jgi:hypothetical protein